MENTSHALILAGEILIAVLVISFLAFMFMTFGNFSRNMNNQMTQSRITEFNNHFLQYQNRINITSHEIATVINFAKQTNDDYELVWNDDSEYYVSVYIDEKNFFNNSMYINSRKQYENDLKSILDKFIEDNNEIYFSCGVKVIDKDLKTGLPNVEEKEDQIKIRNGSGESGMVYEIRFYTVPRDVINVINDNKFDD